MAQVDILINFHTNARGVQQQIRALNGQLAASQESVSRLNQALNTGKASSKALTGDIRGRKAILKLDEQISALARDRVKSMTRGYHFGDQDQFIKNMLKQNEIMRIQKKIMMDNANAMINMGKNTQWAGRQLVVGFTVPLTIAAGAAMKAFADLEEQLVKFKRVYGDINTSTEQTNQMAESVKQLAQEWTKYGVAVADTIGLAAEAAGAGFQGQQLMSQVESATKLSVLGQLEMQKAMEATIAMQSTFKMSNQDLGQSINFLNQLENQTMVTMEDMTTAIPKAATIVEGLGGSVKDLGVFMAALREGGVTAAEGANALKSGLGSLLNPSKEAAEVLKTLGIELPKLWAESEKNGQGVIFVVEELALALEKLGQTQKQQVIEELFGKHQFARMNALLSNINKGTQALQAKGVAGSGALESALISQKELAKLGESSLTKFQAAFAKLKVQIAPLGKVFMDFITPLINGIAKAIEWFNKLPDTVKQVAAGFTIMLGVAAPLFLMLIGQVQNLLGNGLKLITWIKGWGKNTQWVTTENLTLAQSLAKVDSQLIAENKLLQQNVTLWDARRIAAGTAGRPFNEPKPAPRGRFATGGSVRGSGNRDTVPALLTPGEFVVNSKAAKQHSTTLAAMNAGKLLGFANGNTYHASHLSSDIPFNPSMIVGHKGAENRWKKFETAFINAGVSGSPKDYLKFVSRLVYPLPPQVNYALKPQHGGIPASELLPYFHGKSITAQNQPFYRTMHGMGVDKKTMQSGDFVKSQKFFAGRMTSWLMSQGGKSITDIMLTNATSMIVKSMSESAKHQKFGNLLHDAARSPGQIRNKDVDVLVRQLKTRGIEESMGQFGIRSDPKKGFYSDNTNLRQHWGSRSKLMMQLFRGLGGMRKMASGGFVPGTGNKDTVPALLSPGEAVIKKSAAQKFGGILSAMNRGTIGMFQGGRNRRKYTGTQKLIEAGVSQSYIDALKNIISDISVATTEIEIVLKDEADLRQRALAKLNATFEQDEKTRVDASHIVRAQIDAVTGEPIFDPNNVVFDVHSVNQLYEDLSKLGPQFDAVEVEMKQSVVAMQEQQKTLDNTSKEFKDLQHDINMTEQAMTDLRKGRHILDPSGRAAVGQAVMSAEKKNPGMFSGSSGYYAGVITSQKESTFNPNFYTAGGMKGVADIRANAIQNLEREDTGRKPKKTETPERAIDIDEDEDKDKATRRGRGGSFDPMTLIFAFSMLSGSITGVTEKLGAFGNALMIAVPLLLSLGGINKGGGMAGIIGKGNISARTAATGRFAGVKNAVGGKYAKFGLGAGMVGGAVLGLAGGAAGNWISDERGGARDVAGKAVAWGATGAGLGMMFGPLGAAIGGTVGALAGLTVQILANNKAQKKAVEDAQKTGAAWSDIAKDLNEKYSVGSYQSPEQLVANIQTTIADGNADLAATLVEQIGGDDSNFSKRVVSIQEQRQRGTFLGLENEINALTLELRATGMDESSIKIVADALISKVGLNGEQQPAILPTGKIVDKLSNMATSLANLVDISGSIVDGLATKLGIQITSATKSLRATLLNTAPGTSENLEAAENLKRLADASNAMQTSLEDAVWRGQHGAQAQLDEFRGAAYKPIEDFMKSEEGVAAGYGEEAWKKWLEAANASGLSAEQLTSSAQFLMDAGIAIENMSIEQQQALAGVLSLQMMAQAQATRLANEITRAESDLETLDQYDAAVKNLEKSERDLDRVELDAELTVERIDIEEAALADFVGRFNRAFGTSIDSFADAQYEIDKIGNKIQGIQLKVINPLQDKADDLKRLNELDQRKITEIEEEKAKKVKETNDAFERQADLLERIRMEQDYIGKQQTAAVDLAQALASGDATAAVRAMIQSNQNVFEYSGALQDRGLQQAQKEAQRAGEAEDPRVTALNKTIEDREKKIQKIEDRIYEINEKQIEPLERQAALMSHMLATTRTEMEFKKNNALDKDEEQRQRDAARDAAWDSVEAARQQVAQDKKSRDELKLKVDDIAEYWKVEGQGIAATRAAIKAKNEENEADLLVQEGIVKGMETAITGIKANTPEIVDEWNAILPKGGLAYTLHSALEYIENGEVPSYEKYKADFEKEQKERGPFTPPVGLPKPPVMSPRTEYAGGTIPGAGGMDSVPAMLTPGEFVIRKSAVDRIGAQNLERMNRGPYDDNNDNFYKGGKIKRRRYVAGGKVEPNFMNIPLDAITKLAADPKIISAMAATPSMVPTGETSTPYSGPIDLGPIPGLGSPSGPTGWSAENQHWIGPRAVRIMRHVRKAFNSGINATTYQGRDPNGDHAKGRAVDYGIAGWQGEEGMRRGYRLAEWATKWAKPLGIHYVIWRDRSWNVNGGGWKPFVYSGVRAGRERPNPSNRHLNHVHISNYKKRGGLVAGYANGGLVGDTVPAMLTPGEFVMNRSAVNRVGVKPLKNINEGIMPQDSKYAASNGDSIYNNYDIVFNIAEADDPYEVSRVISRELKRTSNSKVKR
jgi:TP901 family phage tail tape measure protein